MTIRQELIAKAETREALFGIIGLGYVGLPLAVELANAGYRVLGYDVSDLNAAVQAFKLHFVQDESPPVLSESDKRVLNCLVLKKVPQH